MAEAIVAEKAVDNAPEIILAVAGVAVAAGLAYWAYSDYEYSTTQGDPQYQDSGDILAKDQRLLSETPEQLAHDPDAESLWYDFQSSKDPLQDSTYVEALGPNPEVNPFEQGSIWAKLYDWWGYTPIGWLTSKVVNKFVASPQQQRDMADYEAQKARVQLEKDIITKLESAKKQDPGATEVVAQDAAIRQLETKAYDNAQRGVYPALTAGDLQEALTQYGVVWQAEIKNVNAAFDFLSKLVIQGSTRLGGQETASQRAAKDQLWNYVTGNLTWQPDSNNVPDSVTDPITVNIITKGHDLGCTEDDTAEILRKTYVWSNGTRGDTNMAHAVSQQCIPQMSMLIFNQGLLLDQMKGGMTSDYIYAWFKKIPGVSVDTINTFISNVMPQINTYLIAHGLPPNPILQYKK